MCKFLLFFLCLCLCISLSLCLCVRLPPISLELDKFYVVLISHCYNVCNIYSYISQIKIKVTKVSGTTAAVYMGVQSIVGETLASTVSGEGFALYKVDSLIMMYHMFCRISIVG